jgi:hypothetical protein
MCFGPPQVQIQPVAPIVLKISGKHLTLFSKTIVNTKKITFKLIF